MSLIVVIFIVAIIFYVRRELKKSLHDQWKLAASSLDNIRCIPGGTVSGHPSLCGLVEGRRIDIAPFIHREFGTSSKRMTGYRVTRDSPVDLPQAAVASLTNHFHRFEVDDRRIFCATDGIESSSAALIAGVRKIEAALRTADLEHDREARELLEESKAKIEAAAASGGDSDAEQEAEKPQAPPPLETIAYDIPVAEVAEPEEKAEPPAPPVEAPDSPEEAIVEAEESKASDSLDEPPAPDADAEAEPEADGADTGDVPSDEAEDDKCLVHAARDLFDAGRNRFEITRRFDSDYADREVSSIGVLRRVDTFANDRIFGRGPGVIAEVEVYRSASEATDDEAPPPPAGAVSASRVTASVELLPSDDSEPSARARNWRGRIGEQVELCGTMVRCDAFDARLYLKDGILA